MLAAPVEVLKTEVLKHEMTEACTAALARGYHPDAIVAGMVDAVLSHLGLRRDDPAAAELVESIEGATREVIRYVEACQDLEREVAALDHVPAPQPISSPTYRPSIN